MGGKNRWKIKANTPISSGSAIAVDLITPGHVHIVATRRMKQSEYILLLETMFEKAEKILSIQSELALNSAKLAGRRA